MKIFITNLHGYPKRSIEMVAQNMVANIASRYFDATEFGVFAYDMNSDNEAMLCARLDGILNALTNDDVLILQSPTWNSTHFDMAIINRAKVIAPKSKLIVFVHDMPPYMWESERYLIPNYVDIYNHADVLIVPTKAFLEKIREVGVTVPKVIIQHFWDYPTPIDESLVPTFQKVVNFAGKADKFTFVKEWKYEQVKLAVTSQPEEWAEGKHISCLGWYREDALLVDALRKSGGFGLHWAEDPYWFEYMKINASYKLSLYLAAGLPVIVPDSHPERERIVSGHLGIAVSSLDEAIEYIDGMQEEEYNAMREAAAEFGKLLRDGWMTKRILSEAICTLFDNSQVD